MTLLITYVVSVEVQRTTPGVIVLACFAYYLSRISVSLFVNSIKEANKGQRPKTTV